MQVYSDPDRENIDTALPDVEIFYHDGNVATEFDNDTDSHFGMATGYYWWACFPGCLPDSDPYGPFPTEQEAVDNAQEDCS